MERLNALVENLQHVARLLAEDVLEPDASREDWADLKPRVNLPLQAMEAALVSVEGALEEAEDEASKVLVRQRTAELAGRTAALLLATGDTPGGRLLLERALHLSQAPAQRAKFEAGVQDLEHFTLYEYAGWALGRGRPKVSRKLLKRVARGTRQKTLQQLAREGLRASDSHRGPGRRWPWLLLAGFVGALVWAGMSGHLAAPGLEPEPQEVRGEPPARPPAPTRAEADSLVKEWPLRALALYARVPGEDSRDAARALLDTFGAAPSLWLEAEDSVETWLARGDVDASSPEARRYRERLTQAHATHQEDQTLIDALTRDEAKLVEALQASPANQELAVALARWRLSHGEASEAMGPLQALGPLGRLTGEARVTLADCHRRQGELKEADAVLSSFVFEQLDFLLKARREYEQQVAVVERELERSEDLGLKPPVLREPVEGESLAEWQVSNREVWRLEQVQRDFRVVELRAAYRRHDAVIWAALNLGLLKLQRAQSEPEGTRAALLGEAERILVSIRTEAGDDPRHPLALGEVYHRLGRADERDAEFQHALELGEPELKLEVAEVYRELGLPEQALALVSTLYTPAEDEVSRYLAARNMVRLSTEEGAREAWLIKGDKASRRDRFEEADTVLAEHVGSHISEASEHPDAANDIARALRETYVRTGNPIFLRGAVSYLEAAFQATPDKARVVGPLASTWEYLGHLAVLERWVYTRVLLLDEDHAARLVDVLLAGPLRPEVLRALDADPSLRRSQELARQEQSLTPGNPEGWRRRLRWLAQRRDTRGLEELARRLEPLPPFDARPPVSGTKVWNQDTRKLELFARRFEPLLSFEEFPPHDLASAQAAVASAESASHAPTLASAWLLVGDAESSQYRSQWQPTHADKSVEAYRQAAGHWAPLGQGQALDEALLQAAVLRGAATSKDLAKVWTAERGNVDVVAVIHQALTGPAGPQVARALQARPELHEAVELARRRAPSDPGVVDWVMAKAVGDGAMEQATAAVFSRPDLPLSLSLQARLAGGKGPEQVAHALFQRARAGGAVP